MTDLLKESILDIRDGIKSGRFIDKKEASISQGIVLRILSSLSWPTFDTSIVFPEYPFEGGRVDYALCHPANNPVILLEVKRIGKISGAELQLFQYAFHQGTPLVILTDGWKWKFYLPAEQGAYHERIVCTIDIAVHSIDQICNLFSNYLEYNSVCSGVAIEKSRIDFREKSKYTQSESEIAEKLSQTADIGNKEELFKRTKISKSSSIRRYKSTFTQFVFKGNKYSANNRREAVAIIFNLIADDDPDFLSRFSQLSEHGAYRKYLGKSQSDLYPDDPVRALNKSHEFRRGWWIPGGIGRRTINKIIEMVCRVTDFEFGKDIYIIDES